MPWGPFSSESPRWVKHLVSLGRGIRGQNTSSLSVREWRAGAASGTIARPERPGPVAAFVTVVTPALLSRGTMPQIWRAKQTRRPCRGVPWIPRDRHAQVQFLPPPSRLALLQHRFGGPRQTVELLLDRFGCPFGTAEATCASQFIRSVSSRPTFRSRGIP